MLFYQRTTVSLDSMWRMKAVSSTDLASWRLMNLLMLLFQLVYTQYCFSYCRLETIEIPETVTKIGLRAFYYCGSLASINISSSVTELGDHCFYYCKKLSNITIAYGIAKIPDYCFYSGYSLTEIRLPESITEVGSSGFDGCYALASINIPNRVTRIGAKCFSYCTALKEIKLPDSLIEIGSSAFDSCMGLASIDFESVPSFIGRIDTRVFLSNNEHILSLNTWGCINNVSVSNITETVDFIVPEGVNSIPASCFSSCTSLKTVKLPETITEIGSSAFNSCSDLVNINIPYGVTVIPARCFSQCRSLETVELSGSITKIGEYAFQGCEKLTSIEIPANVTSIRDECFFECQSLVNVTMGVNARASGVFYSVKTIKIFDGASRIPAEFFFDCSTLETVELPESIEEISVRAFFGCSNLTHIVFASTPSFISKIGIHIVLSTNNRSLIGITPENSELSINGRAVTDIGEFSGITIPITKISSGCFYDCQSLVEIDIPDSVEYVSSGAFRDCSSLTNITMGIKFSPSLLPSTVVHIKLHQSITEVHAEFFFNCSLLETVELPESIEEISDGAFADCTGLTKIEFAANISILGRCGNHVFHLTQC